MIAARFTLSFNYEYSLAHLIELGHYDHVDPDVAAQQLAMTHHGTHTREAKLVSIERGSEGPAALQALEDGNLVPGVMLEMLEIGHQIPNLQRQHSIIALGATWQDGNGRRRTPYIGRHEDQRWLGYGMFDLFWPECIRFLAFDK